MLTISRWIVGLIFLVAGINGYVVLFGWNPFIETSPEAMAIFEFDYLLIIEKTLEIICGILLLTNQFVPLAIAVLSPIIANIFLLHLFLDPSLLLLAILLLVLHTYLLFSYRYSFLSLLDRKPNI
ncbi:hypothetical protein [Salirhabdus sp. Marseille-P4669]|uniref:hypothetical protein n=1 Tax=Salirhabdus sp. Marseille-P4669 TaxID=2042310 RepID=UPI000C79CF2D|nr:hypothetical protein [Salirhabdus sp. Marseille-P4669]